MDTAAAASGAGTVDVEMQEPWRPTPERLARRATVDREDMASVYAAKPLAYRAAKRALDVALSAAGLVLLSPVMLAAAVAVAAEDGRPVIYAAPREGKGGKPFKMYKFRSMYRDAEERLHELLGENEQDGPAFKIKDDPRITRVGAVLRKTSVDELPQLVNILRGEMSVVGPRAIQRTREFTPHEAQRLLVRPGLTCYWQVAGRADVPWDEWVEMDLDYIQDMSLSLDARLVLKTFGVVFRGTGAH